MQAPSCNCCRIATRSSVGTSVADGAIPSISDRVITRASAYATARPAEKAPFPPMAILCEPMTVPNYDSFMPCNARLQRRESLGGNWSQDFGTI